MKDTHMTLDARHEQFIYICVGILDEIRRGLLSGDGDERDALVRRLKPDDLGALNWRTTRLVTTVSLTLTTFSLLFLLRCSRGRTEKTKRA
jgi:hypothetical protein